MRLTNHLQQAPRQGLWPRLDVGLLDAVVTTQSGSYRIRPRMGTPVDRIGGLPVPDLPTIRLLPPATIEREHLVSEQPWDVRDLQGRSVHLVRLTGAGPAQVDEALVSLVVGLFRYEIQGAFKLTRPTDLDSGFADGSDRALSQLEAELLDRLLAEPSPRSPGALDGTRLFISLRQRHESSLPPRAADHMASMTIIEGTTRYLETVLRQRVLRDGKALERLRKELRAPLSPDERRFGLVGAAEALLLDRLQPDWKQRFEQPVESLEAILAGVPGVASEADGTSYMGGPEAIESRLEALERMPVPAKSPRPGTISGK